MPKVDAAPNTLIGISEANRINNFSMAAADQLMINNAITLTIEQGGSNLLLTDTDNGISTPLKG